ncbi:MAG: hypothetical protein ATN34_02210 [Epulopiscium sp. Nele67-Bin002]|nr:MAG: hypothetical protein ATN34_02210 [Epulopiscium sp. Nele67-Bin002]
MYLNTKDGYENFKDIVAGKLYVDKSMIIQLLNERINTDGKFVCITRPRRFGKSQIVYLLDAYYGKKNNSKRLFSNLKISRTKSYKAHLNKYNIIKIDFSNVDTKNNTYDGYINRIITFLSNDLQQAYPKLNLSQYNEVADMLSAIYTQTNEKFIFLLDEWDFIFNKSIYIKNHNKFLDFLINLLKGRSYVALCYMTGILPIKQSTTCSALNMFSEFTFLKDKVFDSFFGFTEDEVELLCTVLKDKAFGRFYGFAEDEAHNKLDMRYWYNGYTTASGIKIFNPRSVIEAVRNNECQSYWGTADIVDYLTPDIVNDIITMINGEGIAINITKEFRAGSRKPKNRKQIYSAMLTWGFLTYYNEEVRIPNYELMVEFELALTQRYFGQQQDFDEILPATLNKDSKKVAQIVHDIYSSEIFNYADENNVGCMLTLAYLCARNKYKIKREEHSTNGFLGFSFHPKTSCDLPIVVELKLNSSTKTILKHIMAREYFAKYLQLYKRSIVVVAINYSDKKNAHTCAIVYVDC